MSEIDTSGIALLQLAERDCEHNKIECAYRNLPAQMQEYLDYARERSSGRPETEEEHPPGLIAKLGIWVEKKAAAGRFAATYCGDFLATAGGVLRHPHRLRLREIFYQMQLAGADAVPFVFWMSGLMGFIMGIQAVTTLSTFGAPIKVADVVTLGTMKEMAPLLTAVILAGRSGAAYAAEIGTMKVKEEIDALEVMGFEPMSFLILPRVLGLFMAGPLLTMIGEAAGILGGMVIGKLALELSAVNFLTEVSKTMTATLIYEGILKGFGFALIIGLNGCYHGLRTGTAAEDVGRRTTASVVSGIFLLVIADALFSAIFHVYAF